MSVVVTSAATTAAIAAANSAATTARRKAQCDALMADYRHEAATLEQQQAYAACVPKPMTSGPLVDPKLAVALLLLGVPIAIVVALVNVREDGVVMGGAAGLIAGVGWCAVLMLLAMVAAGVRFLFS